jgi:hypothetical protein
MNGEQREELLLRATDSYLQQQEEQQQQAGGGGAAKAGAAGGRGIGTGGAGIYLQFKSKYLFEKEIVWNENRSIGVPFPSSLPPPLLL